MRPHPPLFAGEHTRDAAACLLYGTPRPWRPSPITRAEVEQAEDAMSLALVAAYVSAVLWVLALLVLR